MSTAYNRAVLVGGPRHGDVINADPSRGAYFVATEDRHGVKAERYEARRIYMFGKQYNVCVHESLTGHEARANNWILDALMKPEMHATEAKRGY